MYICEHCGKIFDEPRVREYQESREFWGFSCYETFVEESCPNCGCESFDDYDEDEEDNEEC